MVEKWVRDDEPVLLLKLPKSSDLPSSVLRYLDSDHGHEAREAYKCRVREPWFSVPDVHVPNFFLSYMSGEQPTLARNDAGCTNTNSVHGVRLRGRKGTTNIASWGSDMVQLSAEIEGHPLGGGMLKLEPREAARIVLPRKGYAVAGHYGGRCVGDDASMEALCLSSRPATLRVDYGA